MGEAFRQAVATFAKRHHLLVLRFTKRDRQIDRVQPYFRAATQLGVIASGVAQEFQSVLIAYDRSAKQGQPRSGGPHYSFVKEDRRVTVYYFYIADAEFGLGFIKLCAYFPYPGKVWVNGHEWAKRRAQVEGVAFTELANGFAWCDDPVRLQAICDQLGPADLQAFFDRWMSIIPTPLTASDHDAGYWWELSMRQVETSRTLVFDAPRRARSFFEALVADNLDLGRPDEVQLIFGRQIRSNTESEFSTKVVTRGVDVIVNVFYKHSRLKEYLKEGRALRIETVCNSPTDLGCKRRLHHLPELQAKARTANRRLLAIQRAGQGCAVSTTLFERVALPSLEEGHRTGALRFGDPRTMALVGALCIAINAVADGGVPGLRATVLRVRTVTAKQLLSDHRSVRATLRWDVPGDWKHKVEYIAVLAGIRAWLRVGLLVGREPHRRQAAARGATGASRGNVISGTSCPFFARSARGDQGRAAAERPAPRAAPSRQQRQHLQQATGDGQAGVVDQPIEQGDGARPGGAHADARQHEHDARFGDAQTARRERLDAQQRRHQARHQRSTDRDVHADGRRQQQQRGPFDQPGQRRTGDQQRQSPQRAHRTLLESVVRGVPAGGQCPFDQPPRAGQEQQAEHAAQRQAQPAQQRVGALRRQATAVDGERGAGQQRDQRDQVDHPLGEDRAEGHRQRHPGLLLEQVAAVQVAQLRHGAFRDRARLQVPGDVSVVGFDGLTVGQYMTPKLASVGVPWYRVALAALESLIDLMAEDGSPHAGARRVLRFSPELLPGESVAAATPIVTHP